MEKLLKFLRKLSSNELSLVQRAIDAIKRNDLVGYDVKKLTGHYDIYRVRVLNIRIIFRRIDGRADILDVGRRSEKTYRKF